MPLFHVQDSDRPLFVVASTWQQARDHWAGVIALENDGSCDDEPQGIHLICEDNELVLADGALVAPL